MSTYFQKGKLRWAPSTAVGMPMASRMADMSCEPRPLMTRQTRVAWVEGVTPDSAWRAWATCSLARSALSAESFSSMSSKRLGKVPDWSMKTPLGPMMSCDCQFDGS